MKKGIIPGAIYLGNNRTEFTVWAPSRENVAVLVQPEDKTIPLKRDVTGYFSLIADNVPAGSRYYYRLDGEEEFPDPASRYQPEGVHGPSEVVAPDFSWDDSGWAGLPLEEYIIYELHTGAFTPEGTFDAVIDHLDRLRELGVTALELMPVAQFPGRRNWGYDGVFPYAVQDTYGGPKGLKRLVNACHRRGMAVVLDVVYNHLGPEGNNLARFGPYFSDRYHTPWGDALNFDGAGSDEVRRFFIENAVYYISEFHIDALRLDALHAILDISAYTFIEELAVTVRQRAESLKRHIYLIGESAANDARLIRSPEHGGYGIDGQWNDDFHHILHVLLTGEKGGYYQDFGSLDQIVKAFGEGFVYSGEYSPFRRRRHGTSSADVPAHRLVVFSQNHDQVGNRAAGDRLTRLVPFESLRMAAGLVLLSPFIPLLFMGEEYGEAAPFPYFVSHTDPALIEAVRKGRREEFASFGWQGEVPDPQDEATFLSAKLNHALANREPHRTLYGFYRELIRLRRDIPSLACLSKNDMAVCGDEDNKVLYIRRWCRHDEAAIIYNLNDTEVPAGSSLPEGGWKKILDSADETWRGSGGKMPGRIVSDGRRTWTLPPRSFVLLLKEN